MLGIVSIQGLGLPIVKRLVNLMHGSVSPVQCMFRLLQCHGLIFWAEAACLAIEVIACTMRLGLPYV